MESASVEFTIGWDETTSQPYVSSYKIAVDGVEIGKISYDGHEECILTINLEHRFFPGRFRPEGSYRLALYQDALPDPCGALNFSAGQNLHKTIEYVLTAAMVFPLSYLHDAVTAFRYLGPLRAAIPRGYQPTSDPKTHGLWANGLAAWDQFWERQGNRDRNGPNDRHWLYVDLLVAEVNKWLADSQGLDLGYEVVVHEEPLTDGKTRKEVRFRSVDGFVALHPSELGMGITQILPVVLLALSYTDTFSFALIEQPELHLHPRLQCALGDLLILGKTNPCHPVFLIETHSEHLILRILRRIRETTRGQPYVTSKVGPEPFEVTVTPAHVAVIYVRRKDGHSVPETIGIDEHGEFARDWPDDFFESDFYERFS